MDLGSGCYHLTEAQGSAEQVPKLQDLAGRGWTATSQPPPHLLHLGVQRARVLTCLAAFSRGDSMKTDPSVGTVS